MKKKLFNLQKEKTELICQNIKNLTVIMGKIMKEFQTYDAINLSQQEYIKLLTKIKLFLKLTRVLNDKACEEIKSSSLDNEKNLFLM